MAVQYSQFASPVVLHAHGVAETVTDGHPLEVNLGLRRIFLVLCVYLAGDKMF